MKASAILKKIIAGQLEEAAQDMLLLDPATPEKTKRELETLMETAQTLQTLEKTHPEALQALVEIAEKIHPDEETSPAA